ncbi:MAG: AEC family transporter [Propionibacteriaceae bacterium]|nr:AEC family transporter [Propionibacteriaceae bacterium]
MLEAFSGFVIIGLPILVGYIIAKVGILAEGTSRQLNLLTFYVLTPFLIFTLLAKADISLVFSPLVLVSFVAALLAFAIFAVIAKLAWRLPTGDTAMGALASGFVNGGNIGLPVAVHLLGDATYVAPVILYQVCLFGPVTLAVLETAQKSSRSVLKAIGSALVKPVVIASLGGMLISMLRWEPPTLMLEATSLIGNSAIPVILVAFGMSLRGQVFLQRGEHLKQTILASGIKLIGMPLLAWLGGHFIFGMEGHDLYVVTTLAALPAAQNIYNYAVRYDTALVMTRDSITLTTVGCVPIILLLSTLL